MNSHISHKYFILYLAILQCLVIAKNLAMDSPADLLYLCNHIPGILSLLFYFKKYSIIKSFINVGLAVQLGWTVDLLSKSLFDVYIFGSTSYIFDSNAPFAHSISIAVHATTLIPASLITVSKRIGWTSLAISLLYLVTIYYISYYITDPSLDINCVFNMCDIKLFLELISKKMFIPSVFFLIILPTHFLQIVVFNISIYRNNDHKNNYLEK